MFLHHLQKGLHTMNWNLEDKSPHQTSHLCDRRKVTSTSGFCLQHWETILLCLHSAARQWCLFAVFIFPQKVAPNSQRVFPVFIFCFLFHSLAKCLFISVPLGGRRWNNSWNTEVISQFHFLATGVFPPGAKFCTLSLVIHSWLGQQGLVFWGREQAHFLKKGWLKGNHVYQCSPS